MKIEEYNFCLLDTNFISLLIRQEGKQPANELQLKIKEVKGCPVISIHTIKEISKDKRLYGEFKNALDHLQIIILRSWDEIINLNIQKENITKEDIWLMSSIPNNKHSCSLRDVLERQEVKSVLDNLDEIGIQKYMKNLIEHFKTKKSTNKESFEISNNRIVVNEKIEEGKIKPNSPLCLFWQNQLFKLRNSSSNKALSDVNDTMILPVFLPFVKQVFTEKSQAEFIKQMKNKGLLRKDLEVYTLSNSNINKVQ